MQTQSFRNSRRAFTLIELLVVIAIIAILAAILFPVFGAVREQTRQSSTMSNMHTIYVGARTYYEDEGHFPSALFGYAEVPLTQTQPTDPPAQPAATDDVTGNQVSTPMDKATERFTTSVGLNGGYLFGEQVKDFVSFQCPDNLVTNKQQVTEVYYPLALTNLLNDTPNNTTPVLVTWNNGTIDDAGPIKNPKSGCPVTGDIDFPCRAGEGSACSGTGAYYNAMPKYFYVMDSMDIGPMIDSTGKQVKIGGTLAYELHYSPDWTHELYNLTNGCDELMTGAPITEQLKYKNPPSENTIINWNTQHVATAGSSSVLILLASGTARKINYQQALNELPLQYK